VPSPGSLGMAERAAGQAVEATREPGFRLAVPERRLLRWMAARVPRWILPDDLMALGVLASLGVCAAYQLSNQGTAWLWVASALLVVQWFGDSMDGTLARVRGIERPTYGYYVDHLVDAISTAAIGIGLGLSPSMLLSIGTLIVVAYLTLSINVYLESYAFGRFNIGYGYVWADRGTGDPDRAQHRPGPGPGPGLQHRRPRPDGARPDRTRDRGDDGGPADRPGGTQPARARRREPGASRRD
jgi:hypothetical protein